jgi:hypothetical protein
VNGSADDRVRRTGSNEEAIEVADSELREAARCVVAPNPATIALASTAAT